LTLGPARFLKLAWCIKSLVILKSSMKLIPFFLLVSTLLLCLFTLTSFFKTAYAQSVSPPTANLGDTSATSNCVLTVVGKPPKNQTLPPGCTNGSNALHWPFKTKNPSQYRRIDQGWDLEGSSPQIVYAVTSGKVYKANDDPAGFGDYYYYEDLDPPGVTVQGRHYTTIYYGHTHYADGNSHYGVSTPNILGQHVSAGGIIGYTYPGCCWPANWLEIGFGNSLPVGQGAYPTTAGLDMEDYLNGTRTPYQ
jgi:hypothetical protein